MAIRMTGLNSGLDTEAIVGAMMEAHKAKKTKVDNKKTTLEWKQDIWSGLNKKIYSFYTDYASKMRLQASYKSKKATSSNSSVLTATAKSNAVNGSYSIKVSKMAAAQYVTSAKLATYTTRNEYGEDVENKVTSKTKLKENLNFSLGDQIQIKTGDKQINLNIDDDTTVGDFVQKLKDAGLNASFDEAQQRFFIGAASSGEDSKFTITAAHLSEDAQTAMQNLKNTLSYQSLSDSDKTTVKNALSNIQNDPDDTTDVLDKLYDVSDAAAKKAATAYYKEVLTDGYNTTYTAELLDENQDKGYWTVNESRDKELTSAGEAELKKRVETQVNKDLKSSEYTGKIQAAVANGLKDENGTPIVDSTGDAWLAEDRAERYADIQTTVSAYAAEVKADGGVSILNDDDAVNPNPLLRLGLGNVTGDKVEEGDSGNLSGMAVIAAQNSVVQVNGATLESSTTTLDVNGLTLDLVSASPNETITLTVANDNSAVYDTVKDFVNQYNSILADLNKYYYANSARGYDPLTDEQKEEMSDDEIEKWETKIKDSLLRRDTTLGGILDTMRSSMTGFTVKASNGTTYSLANLGITTGSDYKEYGLLHIKGDEDDTEYADETNTLQKMIEDDPDTVMEVLSGISNQLYSQLSKKMQSTTMSSALTFYNDKEMKTQLDDYKKEISEWETKLKDIEDRYYKQFTAMEKTLASMQSQQSALSGYLGM